jgi:hypothetical protein
MGFAAGLQAGERLGQGILDAYNQSKEQLGIREAKALTARNKKLIGLDNMQWPMLLLNVILLRVCVCVEKLTSQNDKTKCTPLKDRD